MITIEISEINIAEKSFVRIKNEKDFLYLREKYDLQVFEKNKTYYMFAEEVIYIYKE